MVLSDSAKAIFNSMHEGINIIDTEEVIVFANKAYRNFVASENGIDPDKIEGQKLRSLRPGAKLPSVMMSGEPILQQERKEGATSYFVNMYPIREYGLITGAISVVTFMDEASSLRQKIDEVEKRNRQILHQVNASDTAAVTFDLIVSRAPKSQACKEFAKKIAQVNAPVLLMCESGTGKGVYAKAIHNASARRTEPFASINCALFEPAALEEKLFGQRGAQLGLLEAVNGGTLFLDEISELSLDLQSRILRLIQRGTIRPVGAIEEVPVDVRIIAASNVDLTENVVAGRFSSELFYALNSFAVKIPPLRERMEDVPLLTSQILDDLSITLKRRLTITDDALDRLMSHSWPGNVRELRSVLEFSAYTCSDDRITAVNLPENVGKGSSRDTMPLYDKVKEFEKTEILKTLEYYGNDLKGKKAAARELGISLASLYAKLK
ncbi:MAG: sigma 54-interacting transcriptional regulator [Firmicutes bacterium]|nr:sigma 54-interacting transcriptional regulator [Bacillota bacterium]